MKTHRSGLREFQLGGITVWDMRQAVMAAYTVNMLKHLDIIIESDRRVKRVQKDGSWKNCDKAESKSLIEMVDSEIAKLNKNLIHK